MKDNKRIGLALSGGGYRAAAFHLGTLRALHRMGILDKVDVISSVSGGSIIAAYYALHNDNFHEFEQTFKDKLHRGSLHLTFAYAAFVVSFIISVCIICQLAGQYVEIHFGWLIGLVLCLAILYFFGYKLIPSSWLIRKQYDWNFFKKAKLKDLPSNPALAINATDVEQCRLFSFSKDQILNYEYSKDDFDCKDFPLSKAVMASSCVPQFFVPIRIDGKYIKTGKKSPWLIDGGLYDNQGTHVLVEHHREPFSANLVVVSDASNSVINTKYVWNVIPMILRSVNILMMRIQKMQRQNNNYREKRDVICAYTCLLWQKYDWFIPGFVNNLRDGYVLPETYTRHSITEEQINRLRSDNAEDSKAEWMAIRKQVEANVNWNCLSHHRPTDSSIKIAMKTGTNLTGLSDKKIDALCQISEWMTELQVKLYLPQLLD